MREGGLERARRRMAGEVRTGVSAHRPVITVKEWPELGSGFFDEFDEEEDGGTEEPVAAGSRYWRWVVVLLIVALLGAVLVREARERGWPGWGAPQQKVVLPGPLSGVSAGQRPREAVVTGLAIDLA
jgi:hypothetical protein